jgi:uncharacterized membrane protein
MGSAIALGPERATAKHAATQIFGIVINVGFMIAIIFECLSWEVKFMPLHGFTSFTTHINKRWAGWLLWGVTLSCIP